MLAVAATSACRDDKRWDVEGESLSKAVTAQPVAAEPPVVEAPPEPHIVPVTLDGSSHPHPVTRVAPGASRIYSRALRTWIHEEPSRKSPRLGYLRAGGSAPLAGPASAGAGCSGGWHPIQPRGFVCLDSRATLDANDEVVAITSELPPDFGRKLPFIYGTVRNPGPIYSGLPTREQLGELEPGFEERMQRWLDAGDEIGASYAQEVWLGHAGEPEDPARMWADAVTSDVPDYLTQSRHLPALQGRSRSKDAIQLGVMQAKAGYAFLETFFWEGRRYGVTTRMNVMPTDRLRPIRGSDFHGVEIGKDVKFPFAFVRSPAARYADGKRADYRAVLPLTGKQKFVDGVLHYQTEDERWIADRYASRLDPAKNMPGWGRNGEKWIDVNLTKQTLMLYEGTEPVFATLISSGEAGLADADTTTATKRGIFRIHTKHVTATMSSREIGEEFELHDVPYVMYFDKEGYALHGAYWHDRFGVPKSHGCINLSPEDARRVFHWSEPELPAGWHGVLLPLRGTVVFVHP